jgi:hypothetical protein
MNPYYGKALAVHEHLIMCSHCGHVQFERVDAARPVDVKGAGPFRRFWRWFTRHDDGDAN